VGGGGQGQEEHNMRGDCLGAGTWGGDIQEKQNIVKEYLKPIRSKKLPENFGDKCVEDSEKEPD